MSTERTTCVVAGGGPAGMILGLLLARAGVEVTVLEKHPDFNRDFRGDTVHASTMRLLDELGLTEKFAGLPSSRLDRMEFPAPDGGSVVMGDFRRLPGRYQYITMVPQWDLLDMIADAAAEEPAFTLRRNTEVTGTIVERGRVAGVRYRTADGERGELRADLTIAADGRWSTLRRAANLRPHEFTVPMDTWWFRLPKRPQDAETSLTARMRGAEMALTISRPGYYQVAYFARKGFDATLRAQGVQRFRERIANLLPWLADRVDLIEDMDDVKMLDVRLNRLRRWHVPGLLCIGDAAHAMSPIGGVGINLAIQDAVAAARLLAAPLLRHRVTDADLARVRRRRWLPTVVIQTVQRFLHRQFMAAFQDDRTGRPTREPAERLIAVMRRFPKLTSLPAYLIAIGPRPEHAPDFARRPVAAAHH